MDNITKELAINLDIEFTVDFGHALPLCIVSSREKFRNWLLQNYMMPVMAYSDIDQFDCLIIDSMQYGYLSKIPPSLARFSFAGDDIMSNVEDIVGLVRHRIFKGWYCILFLDGFHIESMASYHREHFAHEGLLYGFDDEARRFQGVIFDNALKKVGISYNNVELAYKDAFQYIMERPGWNEYMLLQLKPVDGDREGYPYDVHYVLDKLKYYLDAQMTEADYYNELIYLKCGKEECYPGIRMNEAVLGMAKELKARFVESGEDPEKYALFSQYHPLHSYSEFHKGLFNRIQYLAGCRGNCRFSHNIEDKYSEIVSLCEKIRLCYLKISVMKNRKNDRGIIYTLENIINYAEEICLKEPDILWNLIR